MTQKNSRYSSSMLKDAKDVQYDPNLWLTIQAIEKDLQVLIPELSVRSQKQKLIAIQEAFRNLITKLEFLEKPSSKAVMLGATDQSFNKSSSQIKVYKDESGLNNSINNLHTETNNSKTGNFLKKSRTKADESIVMGKFQLEQEIKKLKEELASIRAREVNENHKSNAEETGKLIQKTEGLQYSLNEERSLNRELVIQIQSLEDALKKLNTEYNSLSYRFAKLNSESEMFEKTICDLKHNLNVNKGKFEEVIKVNQELKEKHFEKEQFIENHNKDIRNVIKKNQKLTLKIEEQEKVIDELKHENEVKEVRLNALRAMNQKLDQKSNMILKKWENVQQLEKKTDETYSNYQKQLEYYEEQNKKILTLRSDNESHSKQEAQQKKELFNIKEENRNLKKQVTELKAINEEFQKKVELFEAKFKNTLYANTISIEKSNNNQTQPNKPISTTYNSFGIAQNPTLSPTSTASLPFNQTDPKRQLDKKEKPSNNMNSSHHTFNNLGDKSPGKKQAPDEVNYLAIDDMKPSKLMIKEKKFEVAKSPVK